MNDDIDYDSWTAQENKVKKDFVDMDVTDLFDSMFEQLAEKIQSEKESGKTLKETVTDPRIAKVHSQKAKSLLKYIKTVKAGIAPWQAPATDIILLEDDYDVVLSAFNRVSAPVNHDDILTAFLRACPEVARHGVLESIDVILETLKERWLKLNETMKKEDPNGCLIIQPFIPATSSCVLAPQMHATVSKDHDGVTAGHGRVLYFLLNPDDNTMSSHMDSIGHKRNTYEIEMVYERNSDFKKAKSSGNAPWLTQIRGSAPHAKRAAPFSYLQDGVKKTACVDVAIPGGKVETKKVWVASGLEEVAWLEENITKDKCPDGFVISHPNGSLMSHICAHAREHSIPYIVAEVQEGDRWTEGSPTWGALDPDWEITPEPYEPWSPDLMKAFNAGLYRSQTHWQRQQGWFAHFFHQWAGTGTNGIDSAYLAGGFVGWMAKAILALCLGELRHGRSLKKNASVELWPVMTAMMGGEKWEKIGESKIAGKTRLHYYAICENIIVDFREIQLALDWCAKQFNTGWSGSYGGKAWGECARLGSVVCDSVIKFTASPNEDTLKQLLGAVNAAKNAEHNGGFLYGKFLSKTAFDYSSAHSVEGQNTIKGLFPHSPEGLSAMFRTYELASEFMDGPPNKDCTVPKQDWMALFSFLKGKGNDFWRNEFIGLSENIPPLLKQAAIDCGPKYIHHNNQFSQSSMLIPCGLSGCEKCVKHEEVVAKLEYGHDLSSTIQLDKYPEVYFANGQEPSSPATLMVCQMLKEKKYPDVTPQMWVGAWNGLSSHDPFYPILAELLKKFAKNQVADDKVWTDKVYELVKEEKE